jgi:hypothetical protein
MGQLSAVVLLMCFLANSLSSPIASSKEKAVETQGVVQPAVEIQDKDVKEMLTVPEKVSKEEPANDATKTGVKPQDAQPQEAEEKISRDGRNLGTGNQANEIAGTNHQITSEPEDSLIQKLNKKCSQRDVSACFVLKAVTYINRLLKKSNIEVFEGLHITQTVSEEQVVDEIKPLDSPRSAAEVDDETQLSQLIANKLWTFARTRSLRWSVLPEADVVISTSPDGEGSLNVGMSIHTDKATEESEYHEFCNAEIFLCMNLSDVLVVASTLLWKQLTLRVLLYIGERNCGCISLNVKNVGKYFKEHSEK